MSAPGGQAATGVPVSCLRPALLRAAGGPRGAEYAAFADAIDNPSAAVEPPSFVVYYTTDYAVFTRPGYKATVRMTGARVAGGECINGLGARSLHAADGAAYLYQTGREYADVGVTWDWQRLPGTTVQVNGTALNCSTAGGEGLLPNVGGVTDGLRGAAWMDFRAAAHGQDLVARKAWFFTDAALLAVGGGVAAAPGSRVTTTVESRLLNVDGGAWAGAAGAPLARLPPGAHTFALPAAAGAPPLLVWHAGVGYALLPPPPGAPPPPASASAFLLCDNVTGTWAALGGPAAAPPVTQGMFTLGVDHGDAPVAGAAYAYATLPGVARADFERGWAAALAAAPVVAAGAAHAAVFDAASGTLLAAVFENATAVPVPPAVRGLTRVALPLPGGFALRTYVNATTGLLTLNMNVTFPEHQGLHGTGHNPDLYIVTDASFVPCAAPHCADNLFCRSKHDCDPGWSYDCFANGTIHFVEPPRQSGWVDGLTPPLLCSFAAG